MKVILLTLRPFVGSRPDGTVIGLVDVMDVIYASGGVNELRSIFDSVLDFADDKSKIQSVPTHEYEWQLIVEAPVPAKVSNNPMQPLISISPDTPFISSIPANIPKTLEFHEGNQHDFDERDISLNDTLRDVSVISDMQLTVFKIVDPFGHTHRLRSELKLESLCNSKLVLSSH